MARARNIKPGTFKNEHLGTIDPLATLLFISLWTLADREGRVEDRPLRIKAETFPYRENTDVNCYLTLLQERGFINRYVINGMAVIQIKKFAEHQNPHGTEKDSALPDADGMLTVHERKGNCVTGKTSKIPYTNQSLDSFNVNLTLNNVNSRNVNALIPSSLNPDSLFTNSLNPEKKKRASPFSPPSISEVQQYITENCLSISASGFIDYYESNGWMVGKNKMKNWQATCRTWEKRNETNRRDNKISNAEHRQNIGNFIEEQARQAVRELSESAIPEDASYLPAKVGSAVPK
jgi:hypothetical protein